MKAKNEQEFTTIRLKKETVVALHKICARKLIATDKVIHPYQIIDDLLKPSTKKEHANSL